MRTGLPPELLLVRALAIYEQHLGPQHPDTAACLTNLALLYRAQGKYAQAQILYERALAIDTKTYGAKHLTVAADLNNLAGLHYQQRKYGKAELLYQRALAIYEQELGAEHPTSQIIRRNYTALLKAMKEAEATG